MFIKFIKVVKNIHSSNDCFFRCTQAALFNTLINLYKTNLKRQKSQKNQCSKTVIKYNNSQMKGKRYHSLDACRSVMLLLGLVLHSSLTYAVFTVELSSLPVNNPHHFGWHFVDGASHPFIDLFYMFIHTFRMPVFFVLAGFFSAMMIQKYGHNVYINKRLKRIGIPFLLVWSLIMPIERWTGFFANKIAGGREQYITDHAWRGYINEIWNITGAFWFLYYLVIISLGTYLLVLLLKHFKTINYKKALYLDIPEIVILVITIVLSTFLLSFSPVPFLPDDQDFIPDIYLLFTYCLFYVLGYYWYSNQKKLFNYAKTFWIYLIIGIVTFFFYMKYLNIFFETGTFFLITNILHCITMCTISFGMLGLFIRFTSNASNAWRYISDSSYFVYIIHVPVFISIQAFISFFSWGAIPKLMVCILLTTLVCLGLYHLLARHTWVGVLLNGKKYCWKTGRINYPIPKQV